METTLAGGAEPLPGHARAPYLHAGFWRRFAAYLIDALILGAICTVLYFLFALVVFVPLGIAHAGNDMDVAVAVLVMLLWAAVIVVTWLYYALCEASRWQATPGKLALGLQVTDLYGQRIGFGRATGRFFGKLLSRITFYIGYMLAGWTARKQALHDLLAGCCVVSKDGLAVHESGDATGPGIPRSGMPGWAVALIVIAAGFFMVVPVLAIMAAIAIPAYQNYLIRAQVSEGMSLAGGAKMAVAEHVAGSGALPVDNTSAGLPGPEAIRGKYVRSVQVRNGEVVVTFGRDANSLIAGEHLVFKPYGSRDAVRWHCTSPDIRVKYLPSSCRD